MSYEGTKRGFDLTVATGLLMLFAVPMAMVALLVLVTMGRPLLFRQRRPGRGSQPFTLVKFRTMRSAVPGGVAASDAERLTRIGRALRASSLDELPTLCNVILGHMSLVGPRPLLMDYLDRYTPTQARRHEVRPGITGLAQVRGRNSLRWEEKFAYDVWYVDHRSARLDLRILAATFGIVISHQGVSAPGAATAYEFIGTEAEASRATLAGS